MLLLNGLIALFILQKDCAAFVASNHLHGRIRTTMTTMGSSHPSHLRMTHEDSSDSMSDQDVQRMLDEAMLLYASPSLYTLADGDIMALRKNEVQDLVEDLLLLRSGGRPTPEEPEDDREDYDVITPTLLKAEPQQSLTEISQALDEAILGGYHPNFSEDEIARWVKTIDSLSHQLNHQLKAIPSAESQMSAITVSAETIHPKESDTPISPVSTKEQFESRLAQLKVLIDPLGDSRTPTPLVGSQTAIKERRNLVTPSNAKIEDTANKQEAVEAEEKDDPKLSEKPAIPEGAFFASVSDEATETTFDGDDIILSSVDELAAMALSMEGSNATAVDSEAVDVVSAVVSVAAISAAAVTKLPIFVAGVAMAPLVKSSIAFAQGRMSSAAAASSNNMIDESTLAKNGHASTTDTGYATLSATQKTASTSGVNKATNSTTSEVKRTAQLLEPDVLGG